MKKWISQLFAREDQEFPCVKRVAQDGLQLRVVEYQKRCGHTGYLVETDMYLDGRDEWMPAVLLGGEDLPTTIALLIEAAKFIDAENTKALSQTLLDD
jgi:hypothetical protein